MKLVELLCTTRGLRKTLEQSRDRLFRMALAWSSDPMLADDLAQEALTKALQKTHQLKDRNKVDCWLYTILNNCWREHLRRQRPGIEIDEDKYISETSPETENSDREIVARVRAAIAQLPVGQRETVTLIDLEGFAYAEVAQILDIPIGTVMSRLCRARRALQQELTDIQPEPATTKRVLRSVK